MNKYIIQKNKNDCAPTALFNALIYFGKNPTLKDLAKIKKQCKTDRSGTHILLFGYICSKYFIHKFLYFRPEYQNKRILKHLLNKPAIITMKLKDKTHSFFVEKYIQSSDKILVVNMFGAGYISPVSIVKANLIRKNKVMAHLLERVK